MGKVYEALARAEMERNQAESDGATESHARTNGSNGKMGSDDFDFLQYSLNTPPSYEIDRNNIEGVSTGILDPGEFRPAREVAIDQSRIDPHLIAFYDFDPRAAEQYLKLAIAMISGKEERPLRRVLIASAQQGEGRTSVALNLACLLAQARKRVLVIDTDMRRPSIERLLAIETETGLGEVIEQNLPMESAAVRVLPYDFIVLPARERVENSAELLASTWFQEALFKLDPHFDFILFDSSPLLMTGDAQLLVRLTDATVLVIRTGKISSAQMARAISPLKEENIFGVVLNRADR